MWAASWQNQQNGMHAQRRLRSAWASTQSDQSSLSAHWVAKDPNFLHADSEDSDQTGRMPRLIWVFAGRKCHFVGLVKRRLICFNLCWFTYTIIEHTKRKMTTRTSLCCKLTSCSPVYEHIVGFMFGQHYIIWRGYIYFYEQNRTEHKFI